MNIVSDRHEYLDELKNVARMFVPFLNHGPNVALNESNGKIESTIDGRVYKHCLKKETLRDSKTFLTEYKIALYKALSHHFRKKLPWGSLTGIRPTRIVYKLTSGGEKLKAALKVLRKKYFVSRKKVSLVKQIINEQKSLLYNCTDYVNLYVHIPFCPSRCGYCSFVSLEAGRFGALIEPYLEKLMQELKSFKDKRKILSVYIGGGTPTVLNDQQLFRLLSTVRLLDAANIEFTVEAGRPDTLNEKKLAVLKDFKVTRISINPQTFCDNTLRAIGRDHTAADTVSAYELSRKFGFNINMDLIAGLADESVLDFDSSLRKAVALRPENITVHTLSIKNGSILFNKNRKFNSNVPQMSETALKTLLKSGYAPYYLYRQKNMSDNLENTGYSLKGCQNVFNITSMEETVSVLGFGAGAITKIVSPNSIQRFAALRDVKLYIENFDNMLNKKAEFLAVNK